ncbi:type II secretion system protein GspM [Roseateles flavus]|uniref:Type II secretion system protein GspM n=1 Tax=Roseateles flavus TaxID=3149041 RepID=A0ABV0GEI2_9BURK
MNAPLFLQDALKRWSRIAARIDALSLRERVFLFLCLAVVLVLAVDTLLLDPMMREQREQQGLLQRQGQDLQRLRDQINQLNALSQGDSELARRRRELSQLNDSLQTQSQQLDQLRQGSGTLPQLPQLLTSLLQKQERLQLTRLDSGARPAAEMAGRLVAPQGLQWQAVDLEMRGDYLELMRYLARLEQALPELRWGPLQIQGDALEGAHRMSVQMYVLRPQS